MATIILGTAGQIFGGPIGGLLGTAIGGAIDRTLLGSGGRSRETGRISNPALQTATYGEPIPIIVGRMRTAGNLIWSSGISERSASAGGGKRSGPTTTYSYTASFAVGLVAGRITRVGRVWADGKIIRSGDGTFATPTIMRLHDGGEDQAIDPLIAAAQGPDGTPAFRGMAYVVFEDMSLAEFGNRIPNLTFEIVADDIALDAGVAMTRIAAIAGFQGLAIAGQYPALIGHMVGRAGSLADALAPLLAISDAALACGDDLSIVTAVDAGIVVPPGVTDARWPGDDRAPERQRRARSDAQPGCLELAYYDPDRDYQPGLTRVRRGARPVTDQRSIAAAMTVDNARQLALSLLSQGEAARLDRTLRLPWRWLGLGVGHTITLAGLPGLWRIRERRFENFVVHLDLLQVRAAMPALALEVRALPQSMPSRAGAVTSVGPTQLHILDLPALPGDPAATPRLWIAANNASDRWRRASVAASLDNGASYTGIGEVVGGTVIGTMLTRLGPGHVDRWDRHSVADVELVADRDWLEGRSRAAVLAGGNLALVGDELLQFAECEAVAPRRFRLRGFLRGRRGTEAAVHGHLAGDRFVLIDPQRMLACDVPLDALGRPLHFVATGTGDADLAPVVAVAGGVALRPLAPCRLRVREAVGGLVITWIRRSRLGYGWHDFVDAPLGEATESYTVTLSHDDRIIHQQRVAEPAFFCSTSQITSLGSGQPLEIQIAQDSAIVGPGLPASITIATIERGVFR